MTRSTSWNPLLRSYPESQRLANVSLGAEALYARLLALTGDDGLAPGSATELLYPAMGARARAQQVDVGQVEGWLIELERVGLITRYVDDGRKVLAMLRVARFVKRGRFHESGLPAPPWRQDGADVAPERRQGGLITVNDEEEGGSGAAPEWRQSGADVAPRARATTSHQPPAKAPPAAPSGGRQAAPSGGQQRTSDSPAVERARGDESGGQNGHTPARPKSADPPEGPVPAATPYRPPAPAPPPVNRPSLAPSLGPGAPPPAARRPEPAPTADWRQEHRNALRERYEAVEAARKAEYEEIARQARLEAPEEDHAAEVDQTRAAFRSELRERYEAQEIERKATYDEVTRKAREERR